MDRILQNPFRILGIPINASEREIAKQIREIELYNDMGEEAAFGTDNYFSVKPIRDSEAITLAKQRIDQPSDKLFYSLFWFWNNTKNTVDVMAFDELNEGNFEKAIEFWENEIENGLTTTNFSCFKNLSVMKLGISKENGQLDKDIFLDSIDIASRCLKEGQKDEYVKLVLNESSNSYHNTFESYIDTLIEIAKPHLDGKKNVQKSGSVSNVFKTNELVTSLTNFEFINTEDINSKFVDRPLLRIEKSIKDAKEKIAADPDNGNTTGFELAENTFDDIRFVKEILNSNSLKYQLIADKLAEEILNCGIAYFNSYYDSDIDPGEDALKLVNVSKRIAVGDKTKDRIKKNHKTVKDFVDNKDTREKLNPVKSYLNSIYDLLDEVDSVTYVKELPGAALTLINRTRPHLDKIEDHFGRYEDEYVNICDVIADRALGAIFEYLNVCAKNLQKENNEYMRSMVAGEILGKVEPVVDKIDDMDISSDLRKTFEEFCKNMNLGSFKYKYSSTSTSGSEWCYVATMVYGSYDSPEVKTLRKFRDEYLNKTVFGKWFIQVYYNYSPSFVKKFRRFRSVHILAKAIIDSLIYILRKSKYV